MGNTCTQTTRKKEKLPHIKSDILTHQEQVARNLQNDVVFKVIIENIKVKHIPVNSASLQIKFGSYKTFNLPEIRNIKSPHWKLKEEFEIKMNTKDLASTFFTMSLKHQENEIGNIKLSFMKIVTGPVNHDMLLNIKDDDDGRVTFMLTFAQQVTMKLIPKEVTFELNDDGLKYERHKKPKPQAYNFNIKIKSHNQEYESHHSYNFVNKYEHQYIENPIHELHQEQNDFFNNQDKLKKEDLSEDEFDDTGIDEQNNFQLPNFKGAGTINKVQQALQNIENKKKEKGKIYRMASQRKSHYLQGLRDQSINGSTLTQQQKQQIQLQKEKEQIKRKSTLTYLNPVQRNNDMPQQLSNAIIETYDEVLDWFKIQVWNFTNLMDGDIPQVEMKIFADEFASTTFYMKLWSCSENLQYLDPFSVSVYQKIGEKSNVLKKRVSILQMHKNNSLYNQKSHYNDNVYNDDDEDESYLTNDAYIDHEMVGHAEISMSKFISDNYSEVLTNFDKNIMLKIQNLKDLKVWHHGKNIGICHGTFTSCHVPFFRQMYAGVRTENGISKSMQIYLKKKNIDKQNKLPLQFRQIINNQDFIEEQMEYLGSTQLTFRQRMRTNQDIKTNLVKILDLLKVNHLDNGSLFKNYEQLLDAQAILVNLAKHVIQYAEQVDEVLRDHYYSILMEIINRDELDLTNMGFESELYQAINEENGQNKGLDIKILKKYGKYTQETIERKVSIGLTYQKFLYDVLAKVLEKLEQQGLNEKESQFVHNFSSLAYFRIPQFRQQLLEAVSHKQKINKGVLQEWAGANDNLDDLKQNFFQSLFSWQRDFYDYLKTQPRYQYHIEELQSTLQNKKWQTKFQKTGVGFYHFMGSWTKYILKVQQMKHINLPWDVIEGYETLIKAFLYELKIRDAEHYPDSLKETSQILLLNNTHLKPFLYVIYNKTNAYNSREVFYCYDMLNTWFQTLITNQLKIPTNFDYNFLFKGLNITFDPKRNEHAISSSKALLLLYNNYQLFTLDKMYQEISKIAFSRKTFYFFAHWSKTVRIVFMHFLVYRIYHYHRKLSLVDNKVKEYKHQKEILQLQLKELDKKKLTKEEKDQSMNNYMIAQYLKVVKFAKYSKRKIETYQRKKDIPIQQQLHNNSLRVKLIDLKCKLKQRKKAELQQQEQSQINQNQKNFPKGSLEMDRFISTPNKYSGQFDSNTNLEVQQNSNPVFKQYKKYSENDVSDFMVTNHQSATKQNTADKLSDSMQSMAMPLNGILRDMSQKDFFSDKFSQDTFSDFEDYQNQKILEQGLEQQFGEIKEKKKLKKPKKFSDQIQFTSPEKNQINYDSSRKSSLFQNGNFSEKRKREISQNQKSQNRKLSTENINQLNKQIIKTHQAKNLNIQNVKGKKVYQGKMEHDKQNKILYINERSYKTLLIAYEEFEYIQRDYEKWYRQNLDKINQQKKLSSKEKLNKLREAQVPDLPIKIHKDESESKNFQDDEEW